MISSNNQQADVSYTKMENNKKIAIIGGGAGGLVAAISAAEKVRAHGMPVDAVEIHIYEATDKIGRPILASGNGRCNFSNAHIDSSLYRNSDFARLVLLESDTAFGNVNESGANKSGVNEKGVSKSDSNEKGANENGVNESGVVSWFARHGLMYVEEAEGRLYPRANKSSSVLEVLKSELERLDVNVHLNSSLECIDEIRKSSSRITMRMVDGTFERADKVILACGGKVCEGMLPSGVAPFVQMRPVLCPIGLDSDGRKITSRLKNIRIKCELSILRDGQIVAVEIGEAMFRKYGISGICAFNLSRYMSTGDTLRLNMFPDCRGSEIEKILESRKIILKETYGKNPTVAALLRGMVLPRLADVIAQKAHVQADEVCSKEVLSKLGQVLVALDFTIDEPADCEHAQVQRGGFDVSAFDHRTLQSKNMDGLYVIGEALDVDGPCGGYNLNWAFATGLLAGSDAAQSLGF